MDTSFPDRRRAGSNSSRSETGPSSARGGDPKGDIMRQPHPIRLREPRAFMDETPTWHLWGMMVGFMAAGAAILIILSLKGG
ncbi:MAG: hypothetical protein H2042_17005 [Rhizobiales bacterium]|nr:hypothetical protein [Hyphomicrobiales bacterium]